MKNIIVIGAGMVGSAMAADMLQKHNVTLADLNAQRLNQLRAKYTALTVMPLDVQYANELSKAVNGFDLVICACSCKTKGCHRHCRLWRSPRDG